MIWLYRNRLGCFYKLFFERHFLRNETSLHYNSSQLSRLCVYIPSPHFYPFNILNITIHCCSDTTTRDQMMLSQFGTYIYILYLLTYHRSSVHKFCQYSLRFVSLRNPNLDLSLHIPVRSSLKYNIKKTNINYHCFQNDSQNMPIYLMPWYIIIVLGLNVKAI